MKYKYKYKSTENISVTGLAEKDFVSDQIVWTGNYSRVTMDLKTAYSQLKEDESKIRAYLKGKGVQDASRFPRAKRWLTAAGRRRWYVQRRRGD